MDYISVGAAASLDDPTEGRYVRPRRLLLIADALAAALAAIVGFVLLDVRQDVVSAARITLLMGVLILVGALALMVRNGQYTNRRRLSRISDVGALARSVAISSVAVALLNYLTKGFFTGNASPSRITIGSLVLTFFVLCAASRLGLSRYQRWQFAHGRTVRKILLLGSGQAAGDFVAFVQKRPWLGVACAGRLAYGTRSTATEDGPLRDVPVAARLTQSLEGLEDLDRALRLVGASEVVVALDAEDQADLSQIASLLTLVHVPFKVVPSLFEHTYRASGLLGYAELPVIDVDVDPLDRVARLFKRMLDLLVAGVAVLLGLVPGLVIVAAIAIESGLPIIYKQERVGKNGRRFWLYKFRTMVKDADQRLAELEAQNENRGGGQIFKIRKDPRVTRVGALLRKLSLDELPQFFNVIKGDMSVVGPRPPLPAEVERYEQQHLYRLKALPGITGLWQVSGRSTLGFEDMVKLDRYYLDNWSVGLDLSILVKTVYVVLARKGAY